ncbi:hypothetical protein EVAR_10905_1 [Eumeta japonica]|uniref:Uncharacterized protein n=1 Tax=Eumeta variegata TaxID=151549 RepID=A0A4C1URZ4_EUMVA|nr:hypothetical protein EVAR_10905_1 [Eumeta japonica]
MFASKAFALVLVAAACQAVPVWDGESWGSGRFPGVSFGIGSGISSDIGNVRHSNGFGAAYQSGQGRAIGAGFGSAGRDTYAQGIGKAKSSTYVQPRPQFQPIYNNFGTATSSSQNYGAGSSSAQSHSNVHYPVLRAMPFFNTALSSAQSSRDLDYDSAISTAQSGSGLHYDSAAAVAERTYGGNTAIAAAQNHNGASNHESAVAFAHNAGGVHAGAAEAVQRREGLLQHAGAASINAPGLQVAHAHSVYSNGYN